MASSGSRSPSRSGSGRSSGGRSDGTGFSGLRGGVRGGQGKTPAAGSGGRGRGSVPSDEKRASPVRSEDRADRERALERKRSKRPASSLTPGEFRRLDTLELVGVYGVVSRGRLVRDVFGGDGRRAHRVLKSLENAGLLASRRSSPGLSGYEVFALTPAGKTWARKRRRKAGPGSGRWVSDPDQVLSTGFGDFRQLLHDQRVAEAVQLDVQGAVAEGAVVKRVRLDAELRGTLASASEKVRPQGGAGAARAARLKVAADLGLKPLPSGVVPLPDALVELEHPDGRVEVRGIEVGSSQYTGRQIADKQAAGFRFYQPASSAPVSRPVSMGWSF